MPVRNTSPVLAGAPFALRSISLSVGATRSTTKARVNVASRPTTSTARTVNVYTSPSTGAPDGGCQRKRQVLLLASTTGVSPVSLTGPPMSTKIFPSLPCSVMPPRRFNGLNASTLTCGACVSTIKLACVRAVGLSPFVGVAIAVTTYRPSLSGVHDVMNCVSVTALAA